MASKLSLKDYFVVYAFACIFSSWLMFQIIFWTTALHPAGRVCIDVNSVGERPFEMVAIAFSYFTILVLGAWQLIAWRKGKKHGRA